jgi:hypothetical protein
VADSEPCSRQPAGDATGDGLVDLVSVHRSGSGGVLVRVGANCSVDGGDVCWEKPRQWQNPATGWAFARSRQYLADTNGDDVEDLVSVHRSGAGGMFVRRHVSAGTRLGTPRQIGALATSAGWNWSLSRETVADTWGIGASWVAGGLATVGATSTPGRARCRPRTGRRCAAPARCHRCPRPEVARGEEPSGPCHHRGDDLPSGNGPGRTREMPCPSADGACPWCWRRSWSPRG